MPNWCENTVEFTHDDPEMIKRIVKGYNEGTLFNEFIPCPENLKRDVPFGTEGYQEKMDAIQSENLNKHGYSSWYDWAIANWGTKWDVGSDNEYDRIKEDNTNTITVQFDTAWAPPITFYEHMSNEFKFNIKATYFEPGMCFVGEFDSEYGDNTHEFERDTLDEVPQYLREQYNIDSYFEDDDEEYVDDAEDGEGDEGDAR